MKKMLIVLILCLMVVVLTTIPVLATNTVENPGKGPPTLDRVIFVHYPKDLPAKGGGGRPPETTKALYKYSGYHWNTTSLPVKYIVNTGIYPDVFVVGIDNAFLAWETDEQSTIDFENVGSFTGIPSSFISEGNANGANEVGWVDITRDFPNAIAVTMVWYYPLTKEIVEIDMAMNSALPWTQNTVEGDADYS